MKLKLTDVWLKTYKSNYDREEIFDTIVGAFGVRITPTSKSFFLKRRVNGAQSRFSLGKYPQTTLAEARTQALKILSEIKDGKDPRPANRIRKPKNAEPIVETFASAGVRFFNEYLEVKKRRKPTLAGYKWALQTGPTKSWGPLTLREINKAMVRREIRKLQTAPSNQKGLDGEYRKRGAAARNLRAYLHKFFAWAVGEDLLEVNPVQGVTVHADAADSERSHWLPLEDLQEVLKAADHLNPMFRDFLWTLTLTGQRRGETSLMKWKDLALDAKDPSWTIPRENAKDGRQHVVPIPAELVAILGSVQNRGGEFVFTTNGTTPISGFSKIKKALDKQLHLSNPQFKEWRLHDLRRSVATGLANHLELRPHVIEALLNHVSGEKKGVAGVYNRSPYESDCRRAVAAWAKLLLDTKVEPNVVALRG